MKNPVAQALAYAKAHKVVSGILLILLVGAAWWAYTAFSPKTPTVAAVTGTVARSTVIATVSGSGQVSAENEIALSPSSGGTIVALPVVAGQHVVRGALIVATDPGTTGLDAKNAELSYDQSVAGSVTDLTNAKSDATSALSSAASDMTSILDSLGNLFTPGAYLNSSIQGRGAQGNALRKAAEISYDAALRDTKAFRAGTTGGDLATSLATAENLAREVAAAAKSAQDAVIYLRDREPQLSRTADPAYTSVTAATTDANANVASITSAEQKLTTLTSGGTDISLASAKLALAEKQQAYQDHFAYAPFDGVVAKVSAKVGDTVPSGGAATLVTADELASITLNEVDVAKVKLGQKATLTFDAIDGLTLTGTVASVDGIGTVSQGVVSYGVTIALDTQDGRVKPGMTVNADIETDIAKDALSVPASAVHAANGESYVLVLPTASSTPAEARQVPVTIGITDGSSVVVTSGLSDGEAIVVRQASTATAKTSAAAATSRSGFGGGVRVP